MELSREIIEYGPYLLTAYLAFAAGIMSPGPNILAVIGASMGTSRRAGVLIACGISTGSLIWAMMAVFGLTALLSSFAWFGTILRLIGGSYLLWLAFKYFTSARKNTVVTVEKRVVHVSGFKLFSQGLLIQMTNPKAAMYWVSIMSLILRPDAPGWVGIAMIAGTGVISYLGHLAWAVLFSNQRVVQFYQRFKSRFDTVIGMFFSALGVGLILSAFKNGSKV